ncbi:mitochondrial 39-S ribosomal protein L47 (MRP-L47)-domain-containing protein [Obelidium mucronatum]|nr:mitochondrial 39-S ribosomal protein L47 (MRP-L47)-domain-containing protein [Obelidium mucronatum]
MLPLFRSIIRIPAAPTPSLRPLFVRSTAFYSTLPSAANAAPTSTTPVPTTATATTKPDDAASLDIPYPPFAASINPLGSGGKGLLDFFDSEKGWYWSESDPKTGRGWTCAELRTKSFDDLHKLWWICIKEQNKLLSQKDEARMFKVIFPNSVRLQQVRVTMRGIRLVILERRIAHLQAQAIVQRETTRQNLFTTYLSAYKLQNTEMKKLFPIPVHEIGRQVEERKRVEKALELTTNGRKRTEQKGKKRERMSGSRWFVV